MSSIVMFPPILENIIFNKNFSNREAIVYLALIRECMNAHPRDIESNTIPCSLVTLAKRTNKSKASVSRIINELVSKEIISCRKFEGDKNIYSLRHNKIIVKRSENKNDGSLVVITELKEMR